MMSEIGHIAATLADYPGIASQRLTIGIRAPITGQILLITKSKKYAIMWD